MTVRSPITGTEISVVAEADAATVDEAFEAATAALPAWRSKSATERGRRSSEVARLMRERAEKVAATETVNTGQSRHDTYRQSEGASVVAAASLPDDPELDGGYWVPPTVFAGVEPEMTIMQEEIFGPVLAVASFKNEEDALRQAHQTEFGLAAGVWTSDVGRAHRVAARLDVGTVWINTFRVLSDLVPFGGVGLPGYGREGRPEAASLYTQTKSVWTSTSLGLPPGFRL